VTVHKIDVTPSWDAVVRITLGVLGSNEFYSEASTNAKKHLFDMASILDTINREKYITQEMADKIEENRNFEKHN
jgi:hypothetical protein